MSKHAAGWRGDWAVSVILLLVNAGYCSGNMPFVWNGDAF